MQFEDLRTRTCDLFNEGNRLAGIQKALEFSLKREVVMGMRHVAMLACKEKAL